MEEDGSLDLTLSAVSVAVEDERGTCTYRTGVTAHIARPHVNPIL